MFTKISIIFFRFNKKQKFKISYIQIKILFIYGFKKKS